MNNRGPDPFFVAGGSLAINADSYIVRNADHDLLTNLRVGRFCYVLDARQVGKSSLMVRVAAQLRADGDRVAVLDLSGSGQHLALEQWYYGLLFGIGEQLGIEEELEEFWLARLSLGASAQFFAALRQIALPKATGRLVVFVDEIDAVKSLPFAADEFFAGIRECHNRRTRDASMNALVFCLLGVATPASLVQSPRTTPFNIGQRINLADFTDTEAALLSGGLGRGKRVSVRWHAFCTGRVGTPTLRSGSVRRSPRTKRVFLPLQSTERAAPCSSRRKPAPPTTT